MALMRSGAMQCSQNPRYLGEMDSRMELCSSENGCRIQWDKNLKRGRAGEIFLADEDCTALIALKSHHCDAFILLKV